MNFAVVATGGKQYKIKEGALLDVEKLDAEVGSELFLDEVLMAYIDGNTYFGKPKLDFVQVSATVVAFHRDKKVHILKFKRRKHQLKRQGHRQTNTMLQINKIVRA